MQLWAILGPSGALDKPFWGDLGAILVPCLAILDEKERFSKNSTAPRRECIFRGLGRPSRGHLGATLGHFGPD